MPWSETTKMRERMRFVLDAEGELFTMTELCERYGVSRVTGHKWLGRFRRDGVGALEDRCRAPLHCPHRTDPEVVGALVEARHQHPYWGARKLILWLAKRQPGLRLPAASTAGDILKRLGERLGSVVVDGTFTIMAAFVWRFGGFSWMYRTRLKAYGSLSTKKALYRPWKR